MQYDSGLDPVLKTASTTYYLHITFPTNRISLKEQTSDMKCTPFSPYYNEVDNFAVGK